MKRALQRELQFIQVSIEFGKSMNTAMNTQSHNMGKIFPLHIGPRSFKSNENQSPSKLPISQYLHFNFTYRTRGGAQPLALLVSAVSPTVEGRGRRGAVMQTTSEASCLIWYTLRTEKKQLTHYLVCLCIVLQNHLLISQTWEIIFLCNISKQFSVSHKTIINSSYIYP